jgi:hypothetical protein
MKLWVASWQDGYRQGNVVAVAETSRTAERLMRTQLEQSEIEYAEFIDGPRLVETGAFVVRQA